MLSGPPTVTAELIPLQWVHRLYAIYIAEIVRGIEDPVANELKQIDVILAGPALGDDVDHPTGVLAVLRVVVAGLDAEIHYTRIGHGERGVDVGVLIHVISTVQHVVHLPDFRAVGGNRKGDGKGLGGSLVGLGIGRKRHPGNQCRQRGRIAPVQGQIIHLGGADDLLQGSGREVDLGGLRAHGDSLGGAARLEDDVGG